jgi:hypothetical protein
MFLYIISFIVWALIPLFLAALGVHLPTMTPRWQRRTIFIIWGVAALGIVLGGVSQFHTYKIEKAEKDASLARANALQDRLDSMDETDKKTESILERLTITTSSIKLDRKIEIENKPQLIAFLSKYPGIIKIEAQQGDNEAIKYAQEWCDLLRASGWKIKNDYVSAAIQPKSFLPGILIKFHGDVVANGTKITIPANTPLNVLYRAISQVDKSNIAIAPDPSIPIDVILLQVGMNP